MPQKTVIIILFLLFIVFFSISVQAEETVIISGGETETNTPEITPTSTPEIPVEEAHEDSVFSNATVVIEGTNVTSVEANVTSTICNETEFGNNTLGDVFAFMHSNLTESGNLTAIGFTEASTQGTIENPNRSAISTADASVTGENIHIFTTAYGQGTRVDGGGYAVGELGESEGWIQIRTILLPNNFYGMWVTSEVLGGSFGTVSAWVQAWSNIFSESPADSNRQSSVLESDISGRGGYIFGHSDTERYWHFKKQALLNCYDGVEETGFKTCQRAVYNMEILINEHSRNQTEFETKYNLSDTIRIRDMLINLSKEP